MATIDYKQKIKDYMNSSEVDTLYKSMLFNLFPELKESEDERIRKAIIKVFASHKDYEVFFGVSVEDILAWLEKQGEQKPAELPKGEDYGIDGLYAAVDILQKTLGEVEGYQTDDGILEHKCAINAVKELSKQKPADTEKGTKGNDREIPNSAWSEEDEIFVNGLIRGLAAMKNIHGHTIFSSDNIDITKTIDWLKSLKDRVQPQQQEWSEEDEKTFSLVLNNLYMLLDNAKGCSPDWVFYLTKAIQFIKSLKERYTWKPTDEQLECLSDAIKHYNSQGYGVPTLKGLLNELRKLKE